MQKQDLGGCIRCQHAATCPYAKRAYRVRILLCAYLYRPVSHLSVSKVEIEPVLLRPLTETKQLN